MKLRVFSFFIILMLLASCISFQKKKDTHFSGLDTIIDFSSVDVSPSFVTCDSLIDKIEKTTCFRQSIHQQIAEQLLKHRLTIKDSIDETVEVHLVINSKGMIVLKQVESSENMKRELPELDSVLKLSIDGLPQINPAIKRGIPVTTQYHLPIRIQLKE